MPKPFIVAAWVAVALAVLLALAIVAFEVVWIARTGRLPLIEWLLWLPYAMFSGFLLMMARSRPSLEFTDDGVSQRLGLLTSTILSREVDNLDAQRSFGGQKSAPPPVVVMLWSSNLSSPIHGSGPRKYIGFQPANLDSPTAVKAAVSALVCGCPPEAVDTNVVLVLGLARRIEEATTKQLPDAAGLCLGPNVPVVERRLADPAGHEPITALFAYFLGNIEKARAQCAAGLSLEPNAWDLLLCRALRERSLGEAAAYRESLRAALEASPPSEVAPVLAHALEAA